MGQNHVDTKTVIFLLMMARQDFPPPFWDMGFGESVNTSLLTMFEDDCAINWDSRSLLGLSTHKAKGN